MNNLTNLEDRIWNLKNQIHEAKDYLVSDYCTQCSKIYATIHNLEQELLELENERNRLTEES
jgi:hypothetical protein